MAPDAAFSTCGRPQTGRNANATPLGTQPAPSGLQPTTPYTRQEDLMNRKVGHLIRASLFALPLVLPSVALAQSSGAGSSDTGSGNPSDTASGVNSTTGAPSTTGTPGGNSTP